MTGLAGAGHPHVHQVPLPLLAGMSDVTIQAAHLTIAAIRHDVERKVDDTITLPAGAPRGLLLSLEAESRLSGFVLTPITHWLLSNQHLVIRAATFTDGQWSYSSPLLSDRPSADPPMPGGMKVDANEARKRVTFPALTGRTWLIEILGGPISVTHILLEQLPHDLTVTAHEDGEALVLWNHSGVLTPEQGVQDVDFRSMVERLMASDAAPRTLDLEIASSTPAQIAITQPPVDARYEARPEEPLRVAVRGDWERLPLQPRPDLRPLAVTLRMTARHLGRDRNAWTAGAPASRFNPRSPWYFGEPEELNPSGGLRVDGNRAAAALAAFMPLPGSPAGTLLALAAIRLSLIVFEDAELVVELRANASGSPGELLVPQVVRAVTANAGGWVEIEWPRPPAIATGPAAFWIVLRATRGAALWHADPFADTTRVAISTDGGAQWAPLDPVLASPLAPRVQLFHSVIIPPSVPIELRVARWSTESWTLERVGFESLEYTARVALPAEMLPPLAWSPELALRSPSALNVNIDEIVLSYDPAQG